MVNTGEQFWMNFLQEQVYWLLSTILEHFVRFYLALSGFTQETNQKQIVQFYFLARFQQISMCSYMYVLLHTVHLIDCWASES